MDIKLLHKAVKDLREELQRVNAAIQRIEVIAKKVNDEQQTGRDSPNPEPSPAEPSGKED